ncbi:retron St85 family effector protein [Granulicella mallensis]|uniref:retron St85 family effector protein n=1 Tax=Granulicella mallensis TaxID=940614 RepID=UPI001237176D|nr:retron St85 family effector protein [Granulicella mallensis]
MTSDSSSIDAGRFEAFVGGRARKIFVNVFLCGKAFDSTLSASDLVKRDIRAYLNERLTATNKNCRVFFGEHTDLINQYAKAMGNITGIPLKNTNLALFEMQLAHFVDLIVIFPSSAGSFAELGMFVAKESLGKKLFLIQEPTHRTAKSFVAKGPVDFVVKRSGTVLYLDYTDMESVYKAVQAKITALHEVKLSDELFGES